MSHRDKFQRDVLLPYGAQIGGDPTSPCNYLTIDNSGQMTMAGTARIYKDVFLEPRDFFMGASVGTYQNQFDSGSMVSACMVLNISASLYANTGAGSAFGVPVLMPSANVAGSPVYANTNVRKPVDAATSGCVEARLVWTSTDVMATTGSVFVFHAAMAYISSSATVRTAASTGACATYNYTAAQTFHETSLGYLPSFGSNDVAGVFMIGQDQRDAADTAGSGFAVLGVKLRYLADTFGASA